MKVKFLKSETLSDLENVVNKWLEENSVEAKNVSMESMVCGHSIRYYAAVLYTELVTQKGDKR